MFPNPEISRQVISTLMSEIYPDRIPVGVVVNSLSLGGNTQSTLHLIKSLDCRIFNKLGIASIKQGTNAEIIEEVSLATVTYPYDPNLWDEYKDKIVIYRGCFPPVKCNDSVGVFVSNSTSNYIRELSAKSKAFVDHWVAVSPDTAAVLPNPDSATVIINCVDLYRCRQILGREEIRKRWGVSDDHIVVGYIGRVVDDGCKTIDVIAAATAALGDRYIPVFVGPVSYRDKDRLRSINRRSVFVKECRHVGDILAAIDCFVLISRCEGCSMSLMEAWAFGVPTVAAPLGGVLYFNKRYGELAVAASPACGADELSQAILAALSDKNKHNVLRAKEVIRANYNLDEYGRRWTEYLTSIYRGDALPGRPVHISETPVSIIVSVYNTDPRHLDECYTSIINQTWPYWELIFVDDGSSQQQTLDKLHEAAKSDERVRLIQLPDHAGISAARNVGLAEAKYDLVAVMDSDDVADPRWLARMIVAMKANPDVDICGCQLHAFDDETGKTLFTTSHPASTPSYDYIVREIMNKRLCFINHSGSVYLRKRIISIGGYRESLSCAVDLDLWLRALKSGFRFYNIPDILINHRIHRNQVTRSDRIAETADTIRLQMLKYLSEKNSLVRVL